jgi:PLP dependent protein
MMGYVAENLSNINRQIRAACSRAGRDAAGVSLIGVTKTVPVNRIREGIEAGIKILGENYVQEAVYKMQALSDLVVLWHFIGPIQSNKAKVALEAFACVQTLDRESLARELNRAALKAGKRIPVLIQVNTGHEESKSGIAPEALFSFFERVSSLEGLETRGLMALPPYYDDPEAVRPHFSHLRELLDRLRDRTPRPEMLSELSMGMSHDFETAIEEGATMVRIGTALFGTRATS